MTSKWKCWKPFFRIFFFFFAQKEKWIYSQNNIYGSFTENVWKNEKDAKWNFIHDYYHCYYACISSFQHQHYHQMMLANISKLFCFTLLRLLDSELFRFWDWVPSILKAIYCRSKFLHWKSDYNCFCSSKSKYVAFRRSMLYSYFSCW